MNYPSAELTTMGVDCSCIGIVYCRNRGGCDGVFGIWDGVFGVLGNVFGISEGAFIIWNSQQWLWIVVDILASGKYTTNTEGIGWVYLVFGMVYLLFGTLNKESILPKQRGVSGWVPQSWTNFQTYDPK